MAGRGAGLPNMGAGDPGRAAAMDAAAGMGRQAAAAGGAAYPREGRTGEENAARECAEQSYGDLSF